MGFKDSLGDKPFKNPEPHTLARPTDPGTSYGAAAKIAKRGGQIQADVLEWAKRQPLGFIDQELVAAFTGRYGPSTVRTRRSELVDLNLIRKQLDVAGKAVTRLVGGHHHQVWVCVP